MKSTILSEISHKCSQTLQPPSRTLLAVQNWKFELGILVSVSSPMEAHSSAMPMRQPWPRLLLWTKTHLTGSGLHQHSRMLLCSHTSCESIKFRVIDIC